MIPPRRKTRASAPLHADTLDPPAVGDAVEIFWEGERAYFRGILARRGAVPFTFDVMYDDGDFETVTLDSEFWRFAGCANDPHLSFVPGDITELWGRVGSKWDHPGEASEKRWCRRLVSIGEADDTDLLVYRPKHTAEPLSPTSVRPRADAAMGEKEKSDIVPIKVRLKRTVASGRLR